MRITAFHSALAAVLVATVGGCATQPAVTTRADPAADFSTYERYAWADGGDAGARAAGPVGATGRVVERRIRDAIDARLAEQGFTRGEPADFVVAFTVGTRTGIDAADRSPMGTLAPPGYGLRPGGDRDAFDGVGVTDRPFTEGTLAIDVFDAETGRLVWSGQGVKEVTSRDAEPAALRAIVDSVLSGFPPQR